MRDEKRSFEEMNRNDTLSLCLGLLTALLSGASDVHVCFIISILLLISTLFLLLSISFGFESMAKLKGIFWFQKFVFKVVSFWIQHNV